MPRHWPLESVPQICTVSTTGLGREEKRVVSLVRSLSRLTLHFVFFLLLFFKGTVATWGSGDEARFFWLVQQALLPTKHLTNLRAAMI